ncbi:hypothetical protein DIPPA_18015 [Diplonema papillatum]|nr:hypothetical protein DIPPA_18015 [Diplonema papillatum]
MDASTVQYFEEKKVHALVEELLKIAAEQRPNNVKELWRDHLTKLLSQQPQEFAFKAIIFDLDGCITKTSSVHSTAWKRMFDDFLKEREAAGGSGDLSEFTPQDYLKYVDGKPRYDGVASFLKARDIELPEGTPDDSPDQEEVTCSSLGNRKNKYFEEVLQKNGVQAYDSSVRIIKACRDIGIRIGVASSSKNAEKVLKTAKLSSLIEERVDGVVSAEMGLKGKPAGDIFVTCCKKLGVEPKDAIVVEDATSGVAAGRDGKFRLVIGLAREDNQDALKEHGAHVVLDDFGNTTLSDINEWFLSKPVPQ